MVDVVQNVLFELHVAADFLGISRLLELTSLTILLQWVGVYVRPHFGTVPVLELVIQFWNWNTDVPKSAPCI